MKVFSYDWQDDIYLIHYEMNSGNDMKICYKFVHFFEDGNVVESCEEATPIDGTFRSIISRLSLKETKFEIKYNDNVVLKAFLVYDRAFYPTTPFYQK